jgi:hypothetical protein
MVSDRLPIVVEGVAAHELGLEFSGRMLALGLKA